MPMLKTAPSGSTSISKIQSYLMNQQRQEKEAYQKEWEDYAMGHVQLSARQVGYLQDYLGQQTRGLAVDASEDLTARNWARQMDFTRMQFGHDAPTQQGKSRTYYHFILSPSLEDACSLSTIRAYAKEWAEANFRNDTRQHEYACVYHDDNTRGILHAHIVVNVTNKITGRKLHLDNDEVVRLQHSAQEIGAKYDLTPIAKRMQNRVGARTTQPVYLDRAEREILNKGGYSWKWDIRKAVSDIAPLATGFDDFKLMLNRAGYDVSMSPKTGYLTYTHRNGLKVKDSRLGARYYLESLEQVFGREQLLADQNYSSWELIKISKGQVPWKEDIRRAVDAIAPTVMSIPELGAALESQYGIRLIVNRRGITYQHASGYKTRDISIGFRYTIEGLRQNTVIGMSPVVPSYEEVLRESSIMARHYLPSADLGTAEEAANEAASHFLFRDMTRLMAREGLTSIEEVSAALDNAHGVLATEKTELVSLRQEVMRWNQLSVLQSRLDADRNLLSNDKETTDLSIYNDALLRYKRLTLYMREQAGTVDVKAHQQELNQLYEKRLSSYQERFSQWTEDAAVLRNYLLSRGVGLRTEDERDSGSVGVKGLFEASSTLSRYCIRDFYHLEQMVASYDSKYHSAKERADQARESEKKLGRIQDDIRSVLEMKAYLPESPALSKESMALGVEIQKLRYESALSRLEAAGISEGEYQGQAMLHRKANRELVRAENELNSVKSAYEELKQAYEICLTIANSCGNSEGRTRSEAPRDYGETAFVVDVSNSSAQYEAELEALPIEEARKRRLERMRNAPGRSRKQQNRER